MRKLKQKEMALKKKLKQKGSETTQSGKSDQDPTDYLPKETMEAIRKAAGKHGNKVVAWAFKGWAVDQVGKHNVHGSKTDKGSKGSAEGDEEEPDNSGRSGASASMGQGSGNCHPKNPNVRKGKSMQFKQCHIPSRRQWLTGICQIIPNYAELKWIQGQTLVVLELPFAWLKKEIGWQMWKDSTKI